MTIDIESPDISFMIKEGDLVASFPSVTHKYDKSKFCLIFEKVFSKELIYL